MKIDRWSKILEVLDKKNEISVTDLAKEVDVSVATIRRDINSLASRQLLTSKKGYVYPVKVDGVVPSGNTAEDLIYVRAGANTDIKTRLAKYAASLVEEADVIFIDAGTTVYRMLPFITAKNVFIVTNSVLAISIIKNTGFNAYICPGRLATGSDSIHDNSGDFIKNLDITKAFIGTRSIKQSGYYSSVEDYPMKKTLIDTAPKKFVIADSTKFNKTSIYKFADLSDAVLITDKEPPFENIDYIVL